MSGRFDGKVAFVTGASSGIGQRRGRRRRNRRQPTDITAALEAAVERFSRLDIALTTRASSSRSSRPPKSATTNGTASWQSTSAALS
jgi:hypothetical protein